MFPLRFVETRYTRTIGSRALNHVPKLNNFRSDNFVIN